MFSRQKGHRARSLTDIGDDVPVGNAPQDDVDLGVAVPPSHDMHVDGDKTTQPPSAVAREDADEAQGETMSAPSAAASSSSSGSSASASALDGIRAHAATADSLKVLVPFLASEGVPVFSACVGDIHEDDVSLAGLRTGRSLHRSPCPRAILAFRVKATPEAAALAARSGVELIIEDVMMDLVSRYDVLLRRKKTKTKNSRKHLNEIVWPCLLKVASSSSSRDAGADDFVFRRPDSLSPSPIVIGVVVIDGILREGMPICAVQPDGSPLDLGVVTSIEKGGSRVSSVLSVREPLTWRKREEEEGEEEQEKIKPEEVVVISFGLPHQSFGDEVVSDTVLASAMMRQDVDALKMHHKEELQADSGRLVKALIRQMILLQIPFASQVRRQQGQ